MRTLTLSSCLFLSAALAAQSGDEKPPKSNPLPNQSTKKSAAQEDKRIIPGGIGFEKAGLLGDDGKPLGPEAEARMRAAQDRLALEVPPTGDAATPLAGDHLFTPLVSVKPRRLAPGQLGDLYVVVTLGRGGNVVLSGAIAELRLSPDAGPFQFGNPTLDPTGNGRPVYEDTLLFRVPVTVRPDAEKKRHPVAGVVRLELVDGKSGRPVGVFESQLRGTITVGAPLPSAVASKSTGTREVVTGSKTATSTPRTAGRDASATTDPKSRVANDGELESRTVSVDPLVPSAAESVEVRATGFDLLWLAFGGVVVVVLIILVLRRK